jgi:hypothetical protein
MHGIRLSSDSRVFGWDSQSHRSLSREKLKINEFSEKYVPSKSRTNQSRDSKFEGTKRIRHAMRQNPPGTQGSDGTYETEPTRSDNITIRKSCICDTYIVQNLKGLGKLQKARTCWKSIQTSESKPATTYLIRPENQAKSINSINS